MSSSSSNVAASGEFHCSVEGCAGRFKTATSLRRHEEFEHKPPAYPCPFPNCSKLAKRPDDLEDHLGCQHGRWPADSPKRRATGVNFLKRHNRDAIQALLQDDRTNLNNWKRHHAYLRQRIFILAPLTLQPEFLPAEAAQVAVNPGQLQQQTKNQLITELIADRKVLFGDHWGQPGNQNIETACAELEALRSAIIAEKRAGVFDLFGDVDAEYELDDMN